jgi:chromosome segregation ATPase
MGDRDARWRGHERRSSKEDAMSEQARDEAEAALREAQAQAQDRRIEREASAEARRRREAMAARAGDHAGATLDDDVLGDRRPVERADQARDEDEERTDEWQAELARGASEATERLRRNTEVVRRTGENIREVHDRLQSTADRVQALRETARSLGDDIARTREAVEQPAPRVDGPGVE